MDGHKIIDNEANEYIFPFTQFCGEDGKWFCGPNDGGYINQCVRGAAKHIQNAIRLYCEGHYAYRNARDIPANHGLVLALNALADIDKHTAEYDNNVHDPSLFIPYKPTEKAKHIFDGFEGPEGREITKKLIDWLKKEHEDSG